MNFFNNNTSQLAIVAFMDWFARLSIEKYQTISVSGSDYYAQRKVIPVPVQWATREKFVEIMRSSSARRAMDNGLNNSVEMQWILPRISVNLNNMSYDSSRRLIKTQQIDDIRNSANNKSASYSPTPYNLELEVSTISRNIDENFQLMEQILPFFSPAMSLNLKIQPTGIVESIPVVLSSVNIDNPTDIPENDERIFTNTYTFIMKLNYYMPVKTSAIINNITVNMNNGVDVVKLDKTYIESLNIIQDKFTQYINNASVAVPATTINVIPSTYSQPTYDETFFSNALSALGNPQVVALHDTIGQTLTLVAPSASGTVNVELQNNIAIFYRFNAEDTIYEYKTPITLSPTIHQVHYWIDLSSGTDNKQLEVYTYMVI